MLNKSTSLTSALLVIVFLAVLSTQLFFGQAAVCDDIMPTIEITFNESDSIGSPSTFKVIPNSGPDLVLDIIEVTNDNQCMGNFTQRFALKYSSVAQNYVIQMIEGVDRDGLTPGVEDDLSIFTYCIQCRDPPDSSLQYGILTINIEDVNDNKPVFLSNPYWLPVEENTAVSSIVFRGVSTYDLDEGVNRYVSYRLNPVPGHTFDGAGVFDIDRDTGDIFLTQPVDFDSMYDAVDGNDSLIFYLYTVEAVDGGAFPQSSTAEVRIYIIDTDDLGPTFYYSTCYLGSDGMCLFAQYDSHVYSGDASGLMLSTMPVPRTPNDEEVDIIAYDMDSFKNSISCSIYSVNPTEYFDEDYFAVDTLPIGNTRRYQCVVYQLPNKRIYYRDGDSTIEMILQVEEISFNSRTAYATLNIEVWRSNAYIPENAFIGSSVFADSNLTALFWFDFNAIFGNEPSSFQISQDPPSPFRVFKDGYIVVSSSLDFESRQSYEFTLYVVATDEFGNSSTFTSDVRVVVLDFNEYIPVFMTLPSSAIDIVEGDYSTSEERIFMFSVVDADGSPENNMVTLSLDSVSPPEGIGKFRLNPQGVLFIAGNVAAGNSYQVQVIASDNGLPSLMSKAVVMVNITEAEKTSSDSGLATGVLVGIAVGATLVILLAIIITFLICRRRRNKDHEGTWSNQNNSQDVEKSHAPNPITTVKPVYSPKDHPYAYADGFIHKNPPSTYNTIDPQTDDEEIYCSIKESEVDDTAYDLPGSSYLQPNELPLSDDTSYLTPSLPKRNKSGEYSSRRQATGSEMEDQKGSTYYTQPDEIDVHASKNLRENQDPMPHSPRPYTCSDSTDAGYIEPEEALNGGNEPNTYLEPIAAGNGENDIIADSLTITEDKTRTNQNTASDEGDSKNTYYDTLVPDDPNYSNLDRDHREYNQINNQDKMSRL